MKLDIILITYNHAAFIEQALQGLFMQRLSPTVQAQVIVADDASTDDTLSVIQRLEPQSPFPFVYLPAKSNMGHVLNYKRAFEACKGDYVAILEGDDWWCSPLHLQRHIDFLDLHRECTLSSSRPYVYDTDTQRFSQSYYCEEKGETWLITAQEEAASNKISNLSTCVIRNSVLQKVIMNEALWKVEMLDWLLELMLAEYGFLAKHKDSTSVYRSQGGGLWSGLGSTEQKELVLRQIKEYDKVFQSRYTAEFMEVLRFYYPPKRSLGQRLHLLCPPVLWTFLKWLLPPILLRKNRR